MGEQVVLFILFLCLLVVVGILYLSLFLLLVINGDLA